MEKYQEQFIGISMKSQKTEINQMLMKIVKFMIMNYKRRITRIKVHLIRIREINDNLYVAKYQKYLVLI